MLAEHSIVVLTRDVPQSGLYAGDVGAVVHVYRQGAAYEVEFVDGDGTTIALMTLDSNDVRQIGHGELLHTRRRDQSDAAERE
jgi:hypothetical protein